MKYFEQFIRGCRRLSGVMASAVLVAAILLPGVRAFAAPSDAQAEWFAQAAQEFGVPKEVLMAIGYNESRWVSHGSSPSVSGGYGLMNLTAPVQRQDARGDASRPMPLDPLPKPEYTLQLAADALHVDAEQLKTNDQLNIRGAAAVLAQYGRQLHNGTVPGNVNDWYDVVAKYSQASATDGASAYADQVFATLQDGAQLTKPNGVTMQLPATPKLAPSKSRVQSLGLAQNNTLQNNSGVECPTTITCRFIPAGYAQNSADPADYGNYDHGNRPKDMKIDYIVIHDTEGSYQSAINHFQDTKAYVSCNYIIRSSDGDVTQMVRNQDVQWCAGDWYVNMHSINIEHEAFAAQGGVWYTEAMYQSSAKLVRYLAKKYNIPLDRQHIIGHDNVPTLSPTRLGAQHWDPGPYWDWNHYMALLHGVSDNQERAKETKVLGSQRTVTILPAFSGNQQTIEDCSSGSCTTLPAQGSNLVYLHAQPNDASPLLSDPYLHTDGSDGTKHIEDWGAKATTGQRFVVAQQQGEWMGIWYGGQVGWFRNPASQPVAYDSRSKTLTPRAGKTTIPVYGAAYPEAAAYPAGVPSQALTPLYNMPAGQKYVTPGEIPQTDYYHDATIDYTAPHDHEIIYGQDKYYEITYNHRIAYVKVADVDLKR